MTFMARLVLCSLQLAPTNLCRSGVSFKAGVQERSNYRRIRRFLANYDVDHGALSRLLAHLVPQDPPYVLVLDRTECLGFSSNDHAAPLKLSSLAMTLRSRSAGGRTRFRGGETVLDLHQACSEKAAPSSYTLGTVCRD